MCGRFTLSKDRDALEERFDIEQLGDIWVPRYNIAPTDPVLTVTNDSEENQAQLMRWGLIPFWAKDAKIGSRMINARAETAVEKPVFKESFVRRRCLVVADGFYEWLKAGKDRLPYYFTLKSKEPFGFAGLWAKWKSPQGEVIKSCTIIVTAPNGLVESIHDRMPVILTREAEAFWLEPQNTDTAQLRELLLPYSASEMRAFQVSPIVNSVQNDVPECIAPVDDARLGNSPMTL